jgi:hypothetical protein
MLQTITKCQKYNMSVVKYIYCSVSSSVFSTTLKVATNNQMGTICFITI